MHPTRSHFFWFFTVFLLTVLAGSPSCTRKTPQAPDLIVLHTARLRGNIVPDGLRNNGAIQYYPYIAGYVKRVREEAAKTGTQVLLVDLGDSLSGSFAASVTESKNVTSFFNELHYDAVMLSNLDANLTPEVLKPLRMPVLCPFLDPQGMTALPGTVTMASLRKGPLEVQLLANYNEDEPVKGNEASFPTYFGQVEQTQPLRDYPAMMSKLSKKTEDTFRLLLSMKFLQMNGKPPTFLQTLQTWSVDAVLGHMPYPGRWLASSKNPGWQPPVSLSVLRDNRGLSLSRADYKRVYGKWVMVSQSNLNMVANTAPADPEIEKKLAPYKDLIEKADKPVVTINKDMEESEVLSLYMEALASVPGTQVAICGNANNSVRAAWRKGNVSYSDIYNSLPWENKVAQFDLTRADYDSLFKNGEIFSRYDVLVSDTAKTGDTITVTTTNYLAREMTRALGWQKAPLIRSTDPRPEYQFFADYLIKKYDPSTDQSRLSGWTYAKPAPKPTPTP